MLDRHWEDSADDLETRILEQELAQSEIHWLRERVQGTPQFIGGACLHFVKSLEESLSQEKKQRQELEEELDYVHRDLQVLNEEIRRVYAAKQLTFEQASSYTKTLVGEKSVAKALTKLLGAIYGIKVFSEELPNLQKINDYPIILSQSDRDNISSKTSVRLHSKYIDLGSRFIAFKAQLSRLKLQFTVLENMQNNLKQAKMLKSLSKTRQELDEAIEQSKQHIEQSKQHIEQSKQHIQHSQKYLEESKKIVGNREISLDPETHQPTGKVARQHQKVEQQSEMVNAMQKKVD